MKSGTLYAIEVDASIEIEPDFKILERLYITDRHDHPAFSFSGLKKKEIMNLCFAKEKNECHRYDEYHPEFFAFLMKCFMMYDDFILIVADYPNDNFILFSDEAHDTRQKLIFDIDKKFGFNANRQSLI